MEGWTGLLLMIGAATSFAAGNVFLSQFIGPSQPSAEKEAPYECGMPAFGDARERQSVKFYLIAMIFLLFDIEVAFLYPWAMAMHDLKWVGYTQILVFFVILAAGYVYCFRKGVFDWSKDRG